ncbi:hypothetical protein FNH22_04680 [Fulvivirga sp. M361]|uniref:hypothetical protein n=1 Tax=Fulvivirga sp. M361 TaxID=2594266 RepID=UPI00117A1498|nr:hypothetical protein [Fulvivirga sp. M361]TRX61355.1 hypothetical protein FNH22_04680 [Fulvivirga sp. M361]
MFGVSQLHFLQAFQGLKHPEHDDIMVKREKKEKKEEISAQKKITSVQEIFKVKISKSMFKTNLKCLLTTCLGLKKILFFPPRNEKLVFLF